MPYWIIVHEAKDLFMSEYGFTGDSCEMSSAGFPVSRIDIQELDRFGIRIMNGQTIELELADDIHTMFVSTMDGYLSNEINVDEYISSGREVVINTRGGFARLSHPAIE